MESIFKLYEVYTEKSESPEIFHAWCCMGSIITALGRNVCIDWGGDFKIYPNEYIILVAGSAICRKSRALSFSTNLLRKLSDPPPMSSQKITHEALIEILGTYDGVCTVHSSELATFLGADALGSGLLGTLCDLYDYTESWSYHTKARHVEIINNPLLNIFGASTQEWLGWLLPKGASAGGFTSRVLFIYGKGRRFKKARPYMRARQLEARAKLIERLNEVRAMKGTFAFSPEAAEYYDDWYENKQKDLSGAGTEGYSGRKHTHVLKLSMAIAAADSLELSLEVHHIRAAINLLDQMEMLLPEVYGEMHATEFGKDTQVVLDLIQRVGRISHKKLLKTVWRSMIKASYLKEIMDTLSQAGLVEVTIEGARKAIYYTSTEEPLVTIEDSEDTD